MLRFRISLPAGLFFVLALLSPVCAHSVFAQAASNSLTAQEAIDRIVKATGATLPANTVDTIEEGDPPLVSVYEQGTTIPLLGDGTPFRGTVSVSAIVRKDGSVKALTPAAGPLQPVQDAVCIAVSKWKYKPYLIDGQPVEVRVNIPYLVDGRPFEPSYQRPGHTQGTYTP